MDLVIRYLSGDHGALWHPDAQNRVEVGRQIRIRRRFV